MPLVSIALATYNGKKYIMEQVDSILNQSFQDFEIIIRDDCSTDGTYDLLCQIAKKDNRIILKKNTHNIGFARNFEAIIADCKGKYIAFSDQDDIWEKKHLEILLSIIGKNDVACGNSLLVDQNNNSLDITMREVVGMEHEIESTKICWRLFYDNFVQGSAMLVHKDLCRKFLPVPEIVEFHDYWLALVASLNNGVIYTPEIVLRYRQHTNNITNNKKNSIIREIYNAFNSFNRTHFLRQSQILMCLKNAMGDNPIIESSFKFYINCYNRKLDKKDLTYFRDHYSEMFFTDKYYFIRKLIYMKLIF